MRKILNVLIFAVFTCCALFCAAEAFAEEYVCFKHDLNVFTEPAEGSQWKMCFKYRIISCKLEVKRLAKGNTGILRIISDDGNVMELKTSISKGAGGKLSMKVFLPRDQKFNKAYDNYYLKMPGAVEFTLNEISGNENETTFEVLSESPFTLFNKGETVVFKKVENNLDALTAKYIESLQKENIKRIEEAVKDKNYYNAMAEAQLFESTGMKISGPLQKEIDGIKDYYNNELGKTLYKDIAFAKVEYKRYPGQKAKIKFHIYWEVKNNSNYIIRKLEYKILVKKDGKIISESKNKTMVYAGSISPGNFTDASQEKYEGELDTEFEITSIELLGYPKLISSPMDRYYVYRVY